MSGKFQVQSFLIELTQIENATTGLPLAGIDKKLGTTVEVSSLFPNGFQVALPNCSCVKGHLVSLNLRWDFGKGPSEMLATGVIASVDSQEQKSLVTIEFKERNHKLWSGLLESIEKQQNQVTNILDTIKGLRDVR